eukprot:snap_masked-scaffold_3-processed-gene-13.21-mRNA-1 protein AED:1.00 eAED:1.00 QI:0/-1/0/0/-1/1/1/0/203
MILTLKQRKSTELNGFGRCPTVRKRQLLVKENGQRKKVKVEIPKEYDEKDRSILVDGITFFYHEFKKSAQNVAKKLPEFMFKSGKRPSISLVSYIKRLIVYSNKRMKQRKLERSVLTEEKVHVGETFFKLGISYLRKLSEKYGYVIKKENSHKLILTAMMVAHKVAEDNCFRNIFWSKIGGVSLDELNKLERIFCMAMEFDFY